MSLWHYFCISVNLRACFPVKWLSQMLYLFNLSLSASHISTTMSFSSPFAKVLGGAVVCVDASRTVHHKVHTLAIYHILLVLMSNVISFFLVYVSLLLSSYRVVGLVERHSQSCSTSRIFAFSCRFGGLFSLRACLYPMGIACLKFWTLVTVVHSDYITISKGCVLEIDFSAWGSIVRSNGHHRGLLLIGHVCC